MEYDYEILCDSIHPRFQYILKLNAEKFKKIVKLKKDNEKRGFRETYIHLNQYDDKTLQKHCENKTKEWKQWTVNAVLYYIYRRRLIGTSIPIRDAKRS